MRAFAQTKTQLKEDLFLAVKLAQQKLFKYYAEVPPTMGMLLISAHILDPFWRLQSFSNWDNGIDINTEDETSYTTQSQEAFLKYVENEYCATHIHVPVKKSDSVLSNYLVPSPTASGSGQSSFDPYDLSSDDQEYILPTNVAETTPRKSNCAAHILIAARLYLNSPPKAPNN